MTPYLEIIMTKARDKLTPNLPVTDVTDGYVVPSSQTSILLPHTDVQDLYKAALDYSPFGIVFLKDDFRVAHSNRTFSKWVTSSLSALMSGTLSQYIHEDDRAAFDKALRRVLVQRKAYSNIEIRLIDNQKRPRWVMMTIQALPVTHEANIAVFMADITRKKRTEQELMTLANTDHLTGLSNRLVFDDALKRTIRHCRRYGRRGAVLYIDLDKFKVINDTYGHKAGDAILQEVSKVLTHIFRDTDIIARMGGDEFVAIMQEVSEPQAYFKAKEVERAVRNIKVMAHGQIVSCTASVGVRVFSSDDEESMEDILHAADEAMYNRKNDIQDYTS